jgi:hypothetical protein
MHLLTKIQTNNMKSINNPQLFAVALCAIVTAFLPSQAHAGTRLNYEFPIASREMATGLRPGAKIAMACTKCKTVQLRDVDKKGAFLAWFTPKTRHVCPGCGGTWQYVNVAKGTRGGYTHTCSKCGDKSIFCCATRLGKKTPGM